MSRTPADLIPGTRALIADRNLWKPRIEEVVVLETSPCGEYVKLRWANGSATWEQKDAHQVVEVLLSEPTP